MIAAGYGAIIFDLDGTLADTAVDIREALVRALAAESLPPVDLDSVRLMIGGGPELLVERALHRLGISTEQALVERLTAAFHRDYRHQDNRLSRLFDGAESTLRQLHAAGIRTGICSNKPDDLCRMLVRNFGIGDHVDEIVGSGDGVPKKPDPTQLMLVMERLGVSPDDTLYVGDSVTDVLTARAAGVPVILVSYGYTLRSARQLGADAVIDSLTELLRPGTWRRSA